MTSSGFTLVEVVIALFLIAVTVIALAPLFVFASRQNAAAGELGVAGAQAVERMELLRAASFDSLDNGGNLTADVDGYHQDLTGGGSVRWTIADKPGTGGAAKIIAVRAIAGGPLRGSRDARLVTVRSY